MTNAVHDAVIVRHIFAIYDNEQILMIIIQRIILRNQDAYPHRSFRIFFISGRPFLS